MPSTFVMCTDQVNITENPGGGVDGLPAWSPNGTQMAFASDRDGNFEIYVMDADGSGLTRLTKDPASDGQPGWSPVP